MSCCASSPPSCPLRPFRNPPSVRTQQGHLCAKLHFSLSKLHEVLPQRRNRYNLFASFCGSETAPKLRLFVVILISYVVNYA